MYRGQSSRSVPTVHWEGPGVGAVTKTSRVGMR
jgi:hypothetical protein